MNAIKKLSFSAVAFACLLLLPNLVSASLIVTASGTGTSSQTISASAEFDFVLHNFGFGGGNESALQITLTNTSPTTSLRGNLLTGLFFTFDGVSTLPTTSAGFDGLAAKVWTTPTSLGGYATNVDIAPAVNNTATDGTYQLSNGPFGTANSGADYSAYEYGIGTVGYGLTGFSGSATEGDNYGIASAGTVIPNTGGLAAAVPLIDTRVIFWILKPETLTSLGQLTNLAFAYGSLPDNRLIADVPEPKTLLLLGAGLLVIGLLGRRVGH